mgnify:CR=1 FL=1
MGFDLVKSELAKGRGGSRKYAHNTYLHTDGENIAMRYHETDVAIFAPDFVELQTGGWLTSTTKERLNWALGLADVQAGGVSSRNKVWYEGDPSRR